MESLLGEKKTNRNQTLNKSSISAIANLPPSSPLSNLHCYVLRNEATHKLRFGWAATGTTAALRQVLRRQTTPSRRRMTRRRPPSLPLLPCSETDSPSRRSSCSSTSTRRSAPRSPTSVALSLSVDTTHGTSSSSSCAASSSSSSLPSTTALPRTRYV